MTFVKRKGENRIGYGEPSNHEAKLKILFQPSKELWAKSAHREVSISGNGQAWGPEKNLAWDQKLKQTWRN